MSETETMEAKPLTKRTALDYLERQGKPVTAKELAIDLDSRTSTASELLERMTAQGLTKRDEKQRPREYVLTDTGRARLAFFRSQDRSLQQAPAVGPPESPSGNPGSDEGTPVALDTPDAEDLKQEIRAQFQGLRKDMRDLFEESDLRRVPEERLPEHAERIRHRLESLAEQVKTDAKDEAARDLYRARYELRSLGLFDSKDEVKARIAELEAKVEEGTAEQVKRLVGAEADASWGDDTLRVVLGLREALHFPASVFGRGSDNDGGDVSSDSE